MVLKIKSVKKEELAKLFIKLGQDEYDLVKGSTIIFPENKYEAIKKAGSFPHMGLNISADLLVPFDEEDESTSVNKEYNSLINHLNSKFINSKPLVDAIYPALCLGKNALIYGKGGFGKSQMTEFFLEKALELGMITEEPFVIAFGEGLTEEMLFGGLDMKEITETGKYVYLVENSFMNHETVVIEEIFDAPPQVLLSLKDIITSGYFRKGEQMFKCRTKRIIALTNKSKEEFAEDNSLEALVQRFPITTKLEWEDYEVSTWIALFKKVFEESFYKKNEKKLRDLAEIFKINNMTGNTFVSPRTAVAAAELYCFGSSLDLISDIDQEIVKGYFKGINANEKEVELDLAISRMESYLDSISTFIGVDVEKEDDDEELMQLLGAEEDVALKKDVKLTPNKIAVGLRKCNLAGEFLSSKLQEYSQQVNGSTAKKASLDKINKRIMKTVSFLNKQ